MLLASPLSEARRTPKIITRPADETDAALIHELYRATPAYFEIISIPVPTLAEVRTDLATNTSDPRRHIELVLLERGGDGPAAQATTGSGFPALQEAVGREAIGREAVGREAGGREAAIHDPVSGLELGGYLDYKLDYPEPGDATVNLLLIPPWLQNRGIGAACERDLEQRLDGRARRLLASIYGKNPRARRFWERLGYRFAIDAKPILDWYAKQLATDAAAQ